MEEVNEIENIFMKDNEFKCFGCSSTNSFGLELKFYHDKKNDQVKTYLVAEEKHSSFVGVIHGGILATITDDVSFWALFTKFKRLAFTKSMNIEYKGMGKIGNKLEAIAKVENSIEDKKNIVNVNVKIIDSVTNVLCSVATVSYIFPKKQMMQSFLKSRPNFYQQYLGEDEDQNKQKNNLYFFRFLFFLFG